jgi:N-methylhydantoinase B/oxoprolinase/acetone carboxylase alpha subunit
MTNTKITDPETFERRYPVILHEFSIREGSGGKGLYNGEQSSLRNGRNDTVRALADVVFLQAATVSLEL